ncbi:RHS repeat-associated core domain-containing protein [Rathayibacter sp. AY1A7]|uniref:RHS repeat-associated core domain-containing protein n=1 Tax=Rathayibacter sp. AY1A7 TaxID=2080524 RepID=UPI0011B08D12|nr:RHS repeat-associated core domain-containing protein [Rathayibacter sp. AY1A7]
MTISAVLVATVLTATPAFAADAVPPVDRGVLVDVDSIVGSTPDVKAVPAPLSEEATLPEPESFDVDLSTDEPAPTDLAEGGEEPSPSATPAQPEPTTNGPSSEDPSSSPSSSPADLSTPAMHLEAFRETSGQTAEGTASSEELGDTGITVQAVPSDGASAVDSVSVAILSAEDAAAKGATGLTLEVTRTDGASTPGTIELSVPDALTSALYGGDYASRVSWVQIPATSSKKTAAATPLETENSEGANVMSVQTSSTPTLVTAAAATSSTQGSGDYSATSLASSSTWDVSAQTGAFVWSYPLAVPPAAAGPKPDLAFAYNSQSIDGRTSSTNNQTSVVGEGWDLAGSGFIERSYIPCALDDNASSDAKASGDECWKTDNATMSFGGHSGPLVRVGTTNVWKLEQDDGSRIEKLTGSSECANNGAKDAECWRMTTTDGTQYFFGRNRLPGWASGKTETKSVFTTPIFGNDTGEPCHASTFAASSCSQAWRWNLDYVVDTHGNAEAFYYAQETNHFKSTAGTGSTGYVRGGVLMSIEYGLKVSNVYTANAATGKVSFGYNAKGRCNASDTSQCAPLALGGDVETPGVNGTAGSASVYPDVPFDLNCKTGTCDSQRSPTFWSTARLDTVTTQVRTASAYTTVDTWTLGHSFPTTGDGTDPALWLDSVAHAGGSGASTLQEGTTTFTGAQFQNRARAAIGYALLNKMRLNAVKLPTGGGISVTYLAPECDDATVQSAVLGNLTGNTKRCFPQWWTPKVTGAVPRLDLFNKYVVSTMLESPQTNGAIDATKVSTYEYSGGVAWRYDKNPLMPEAKRTWSDYAGYAQLTIRVGDPNTSDKRIRTDYVFYRGLDGDKDKSGTQTVPGTSVTDDRWFAGRVREVKSYVDTTVLNDTVTTPWASAVSAADGVRQSRKLGDGTVQVTEPLASGTNRVTTTTTTFDATYGYPTKVSLAAPTGELSTCTTTSYATPNTTAWIIGLSSEVLKVGKVCGTPPSYPGDVIVATRAAYDGAAVGAAATLGDTTANWVAKSYSESTATWLKTSDTSYDSLGRVTSVADVGQHTTTTAYTPAANAAAGSGAPSQIVVTNPKGWQTTNVLDPARGQVITSTDPNGRITSTDYDALGRLKAVWQPGWLKADNPDYPSVSFTYAINSTGISTVETQTIKAGRILKKLDVYDGLGKIVQSRTPGPENSTIVADTQYDSLGQVTATNGPYGANTAYSSSAVVLQAYSSNNIPTRTVNTYDSAGRITTAALYEVGNHLRSKTTTAYSGVDRVDVTPPAGATAETTYTNAQGLTSKLVQWQGVVGSASPVTTTYSYNAQGQMATMKDQNNNTWSWTYDVRGRTTASSDPDTGSSNFTYDDSSNMLTSVDGRGIILKYTYDELNRKTAQLDGSDVELADWTYDARAKGQLTASSSTAAGKTYTKTINTIDDGYRPTSITTAIPTGAAAFAGFTYTEGAEYYADGALKKTILPAVAGAAGQPGLPAETVQTTYDSLGAVAGSTGLRDYVGSVVLTNVGEVAQFQSNPDPNAAGRTTMYTTTDHDDATGQITAIRNLTIGTNGVFTVADRTIGRNLAGGVTSILTKIGDPGIDTVAPSSADTAAQEMQCFAYDPLQNLKDAWTPASSSGAWSCGSSGAGATLGGSAAYRTTYAVDPITGNRTAQSTAAAASGGVASTTSYTYGAAGHAHAVSAAAKTVGTASPATSSYTYDASGNTLTRPGQTLTWDARSKVSTITAGSATQSNIYDADGGLLVRIDSAEGGRLLLGSTELRRSPGSSTTFGTRTYSFNGAAVAERTTTAAAPATNTVVWLATDTVGTASVSVDQATGSIRRRFMDPYGNTRGAGIAWTSNHSYLNALLSATSGLSHLGAREYDAILGKFISPDPILAPFEPQQNNGYSYSQNSPISRSDPSGLQSADSAERSHSTAAVPAANGTGQMAPPGPGPANPHNVPGSKSAPKWLTQKVLNNWNWKSGATPYPRVGVYNDNQYWVNEQWAHVLEQRSIASMPDWQQDLLLKNKMAADAARPAVSLLLVALGGVGGKSVSAEAQASELGGALSSANKNPQSFTNLASGYRTKHIIDGHMVPGEPGNSLFPESWSAEKIMHEVSDIATDPSLKWRKQTGSGGDYTKRGDAARFIVTGERDGVVIDVIVEPAGEGIISGYPHR